jgi:hypothetical protein
MRPVPPAPNSTANNERNEHDEPGEPASALPEPRRNLSQLAGRQQPIQRDDGGEDSNRNGWREESREHEPEQGDRSDEGEKCREQDGLAAGRGPFTVRGFGGS